MVLTEGCTIGFPIYYHDKKEVFDVVEKNLRILLNKIVSDIQNDIAKERSKQTLAKLKKFEENYLGMLEDVDTLTQKFKQQEKEPAPFVSRKVIMGMATPLIVGLWISAIMQIKETYDKRKEYKKLKRELHEYHIKKIKELEQKLGIQHGGEDTEYIGPRLKNVVNKILVRYYNLPQAKKEEYDKIIDLTSNIVYVKIRMFNPAWEHEKMETTTESSISVLKTIETIVKALGTQEFKDGTVID